MVKLQKVIRGKITRNKISNEIGQIETQLAGIENLVKKKAPQSTADFLNLSQQSLGVLSSKKTNFLFKIKSNAGRPPLKPSSEPKKK